MHRNTDRILTTHPGRLPNPANMAAVQAAKAGGDKAAFESETKTGIAQMIARQKQIGIDIMSDGEFWKGRNQAYYDSRVTGITSMPLQPGQSPSLTHDLRERTSPEFKAFYDAFDKVGNAPMPGVVNPPASVRWAITSEVKSQGDAAIKEEIALVTNALEAAGEKKENFFFPVLGPGWLDHFVMNDYYKTEEEYVYAMALVAKADFKAVADAGFVLQIDDPGLVDTWAMLEPGAERRRLPQAHPATRRGHELGPRGRCRGEGSLPHLLGQLAHASRDRPAAEAHGRHHAAGQGRGVQHRGRGRAARAGLQGVGRRPSSRTARCSSPA